ncbi:hypothetical protein ABPG75_010124 [Micractinium tetrahymenae]
MSAIQQAATQQLVDDAEGKVIEAKLGMMVCQTAVVAAAEGLVMARGRVPAELHAATTALLLLAGATHADPALDITLAESGCPAVTADLLAAFATNADGSTPVTRDQAAALACHLQPVLTRAAAGDDAAQALLTAVYQAWRLAFRPQTWGGKPDNCKSNWLANLQAVVAININSDSRFWAGLYAYSCMSTDDFAATVLMTPATATATSTKKNGNRKMLAFLPGGSRPPAPTYAPAINWLTAGKVLPAGFQAACGSSWAFAAAAALESKLMIDTQANTTAALSPQHIMYAAERGVTTDDAYRYRPATPGSDVDAKGFLLQCDRPFLTGKAAKAGLARISATPAYRQVSPANSKAALLHALAAQPAVATLAVDASFQHYAGGIWTSSACAASPNHALLLVGYATLPAGQEHLLAKSSLGAAWGEAGFVHVAMTADGPGMCSLYRAAFQPSAVSVIAPVQPGNSDH